MSEADNIERVIFTLKKIPEKNLLLIDLANRIPMKNGELDYDEVNRLQPEVEMAIAEAKMYGTETLRAVHDLKNLGHKESDEDGGGIEEDDDV